MILKHNYYFFKKAIPVSTCKKILKAGRKRIAKKATTLGDVPLARDSTTAWLSEPWIYNDIINPFVHMANKQAGWNFQWDWNEDSQFTIYEKGEYYMWHTDQSYTPIKSKGKNVDGKYRKLSLTLQLTDQTEYEGGDFQFAWIIHGRKDLVHITTADDLKEIGTIIIFPSFIWHQVLPVTKGKRESLVNWSLGEAFK